MSTVADKLADKAPKGGKQVRLRLVYVDFWSAIKLGFVLSIIAAVVLVVVVVLLWGLLTTLGIFEKLDEMLGEFLSSDGAIGGGILDLLSFQNVLMYSIIFGGLLIVVFTALSGIGSIIYNLTAKLTGGILVGFSNQ